jgi:hypothetical protein
VREVDEKLLFSCWVNLPAKKLLVLSCPRSGSRYVAKALKTATELDVPHERMGQHGIVTSFFATDMPEEETSHKGVRSDYTFAHIWHLVRHPLPWIRSAACHLGEGFWQNQTEFTGIEVPCCKNVRTHRRPDRAWPQLGLYWVAWNALMEAQDPELLIRLEDVEEIWSEMMGLLGLGSTFPARLKAVGGDSKLLEQVPEVTWEMLGSSAEPVQELARRYGYVT